MRFINFTTVEYFFWGPLWCPNRQNLIDIGYEARIVFLFDVVITFRFWYWDLMKKGYLAVASLAFFSRLRSHPPYFLEKQPVSCETVRPPVFFQERSRTLGSNLGVYRLWCCHGFHAGPLYSHSSVFLFAPLQRSS
jgi:hypothetical protein